MTPYKPPYFPQTKNIFTSPYHFLILARHTGN